MLRAKSSTGNGWHGRSHLALTIQSQLGWGFNRLSSGRRASVFGLHPTMTLRNSGSSLSANHLCRALAHFYARTLSKTTSEQKGGIVTTVVIISPLPNISISMSLIKKERNLSTADNRINDTPRRTNESRSLNADIPLTLQNLRKISNIMRKTNTTK